MDAFGADGAVVEDPMPRVFPIGSDTDIIYRRILGLKGCPTEFRREFLERGWGFYVAAGDKTVFANFLPPHQQFVYYALFNSNQGTVVHLGINVYDSKARPAPLLVQKMDVLWNAQTNELQAYVDPYWAPMALQMLAAIFPQTTTVTQATFQTLTQHYSIPDLSAYDTGVHLVTFREWDAAFPPPHAVADEPPTRERIAMLPAFTDPSFILHYAALCRHGWVHTGLCPFDYEFAYTMNAAAPDLPLLTLAAAPAAPVAPDAPPPAYYRCHVRLASRDYDPTTTVLRLDLTGCFAAPTAARVADVPFAVRLCWDLAHNVLYFPTGAAATSTTLRLPVGTTHVRSWVTSQNGLLSFLQDVFVANVPRILWNDAYAVHYARQIIGGLTWLSAFRAATRDRLPDRVYHTMGMSEVPKGIRDAYRLRDVLPTTGAALRDLCARPVKRPTLRDPRLPHPPRPICLSVAA